MIRPQIMDGTMIDIKEITKLQTLTVDRWHEYPVDNKYEGFLKLVCEQHSFNYLLWHEEDIARSRDVTDAEIARVKRSIDGYNQQRNDWIEKIDDQIASIVDSMETVIDPTAPMNTETPGCTIDRLSILALRLYHLHEQLERDDVSEEHFESVRKKIAVCRLQQDDLSRSLGQLLDDILSGKKRHRTYRQFKMYNDPTLNPYLYQPSSMSPAKPHTPTKRPSESVTAP